MVKCLPEFEYFYFILEKSKLYFSNKKIKSYSLCSFNIFQIVLCHQYTTGKLHLKWNTFFFKILHEDFFTLKICMRIDIAKP